MSQGRPSIYTADLADSICQMVACGMSMREICRADDMPAMSSVFLWLRNKDGFSEQYEKAKHQGCMAMADEILAIADDGTNDWMEQLGKDGEVEGYKLNGEAVSRSKLRVDSRKWLLSKLMPKKYGDKIAQEITGADGGAIETSDMSERDIARRIAFALAKGAKK